MAIALQMDETKIDTSKELASAGTIPGGWYKVALTGETEERKTAKGTAVGAFFKFQILDGAYKGREIQLWFATRALVASENWQVENTNAICLRVARATGLTGRLVATSQLYGRPFYVELTVTKSEKKQVNDETGGTDTKTYWNNNFPKGAPDDFILSVNEYRLRDGGAAQPREEEAAQDAAGTPTRRIIKKKATAAPAPAPPFDADAEEDEF